MKKILFVAALMPCSYLFAQDSTKTLDEVTVSASRFPSKSLQTGKVVIVITKTDIEKSGSRSLSQLISEEAGVYINGAFSNPGKDKSIYLRGANVEHTLLTIDGVPVYDATGIGSNFDIRNIPLEMVDRIEILKGSHGSLYGSDAVAGVINIITKKPEQKKILVDGSMSYGSYNSFKSSIDLSGKNKKTGYEIGYNYYNSDGISEAASKTGGKQEADGFKQHSVHAALDVAPTPKIGLHPYFRFSSIKGGLDQDAFVDDKDFTYSIKNTQAGIRNEFKTAKGTLKQLYQFTETHRDFNNDSMDYNPLYEKNSFAKYKSGEHFADIYFVHPLKKFTGTIGTDFRASSTHQVSYYNYGFGGSPDTLIQPARQNQFSVYGAVNYLNNGFSIEVGGRYNMHSKYGGNFAYNFNPSYVVNRQLKIFSNISSGYRTPGLYQLYSVYGNKDLKPEESVNIEAGTQLFFKENKANARITFFTRDIKNLIIFYTDANFVTKYINRDRQKTHGVEFDAKADFGKINVKAFYTFVDGDIISKKGTKDTSFFNLYRRPNHSAALHIGCQLTPKLFASLQANYNGKAKDIYFDMSSFSSSEVTLKDYLLVNFYAEYAVADRKIVVFSELRNILNAKYQEVYGYNTPGFNLYGGFRFKF
jgi:vitamin B12 transporter